MKKYSLIISIVIILIFVLGGWYLINNKNRSSQSKNSLTEPEARKIAEKSCIKGGEALEPGIYNKNSKTWWYEANLNATREGCNPACVVSSENKTAEINWRCTGVKKPKQKY